MKSVRSFHFLFSTHVGKFYSMGLVIGSLVDGRMGLDWIAVRIFVSTVMFMTLSPNTEEDGMLRRVL